MTAGAARPRPCLVGALAAAVLASGCAGVGLQTTVTGSFGESTDGTFTDGTTDGKTDNGWFIASMVLLGITAVGLATQSVIALASADGYLDRHGREVQLALARGEGAFVDDVAAALHVPAALTPRVGAALRGARSALEEALGRASGAGADGRAPAFFGAVGRALAADPVLAGYLSPGAMADDADAVRP